MVSCLCWDPTSQYLVSGGGSDRHVRVWNNIPGGRVHLAEMKSELVKDNSDAIKVQLKNTYSGTSEQGTAWG